MKQILITGGGTSEPIDSVRTITNTATGRLGSLIADAFAQYEDAEHIFYLCGKDSLRPTSKRVTVLPILGVDELKNEVEALCGQYDIDIIVHSMAVSDYRVKAVSDLFDLSEHLLSQISHCSESKEAVKEMLLQAISETNRKKNGEKISSQLKAPLLLLEPTPKILSMFRSLAPKAAIVGFKLLNEVSRQELIDTAYRLLSKNDCDFVLANDMSQIKGDEHRGYLIDRQKKILSFESKQEIAHGIAAAILERSIR